MFKGEEEVYEVTPHSEATAHQRGAGGIVKHNTNAVKNLPATQAFPGDNVDEGSSPEPPAKTSTKAKQAAKLAAGVPARGRGGAGAMPGSRAFGSRPPAARQPWQL
eukprot:jgi/Tetstr1/423156/TSEL_013924.t1